MGKLNQRLHALTYRTMRLYFFFLLFYFFFALAILRHCRLSDGFCEPVYRVLCVWIERIPSWEFVSAFITHWISSVVRFFFASLNSVAALFQLFYRVYAPNFVSSPTVFDVVVVTGCALLLLLLLLTLTLPMLVMLLLLVGWQPSMFCHLALIWVYIVPNVHTSESFGLFSV